MNIRLQSGGAYLADIDQLRSLIRSNGTRNRFEPLTIRHRDTEFTVDLTIHLAYQANHSIAAPNASLYIVSFEGQHGPFWFNVVLPGVPVGPVLPGHPDGSYASLGRDGELPEITSLNLVAAIDTLSNYGGEEGPPRDVCDALVRLIVATSEAARFRQIAIGVDQALRPAGRYEPPIDLVRRWGGHVLDGGA